MNICWRKNAAVCDLGRAEIFNLFLLLLFISEREEKKYRKKKAKNLKVKGNFFQEISVAVTVTLLKKQRSRNSKIETGLTK